MSEQLPVNDDHIAIIYITFFIIVCIVLLWLFIIMGDDAAKILDDLSQNEEDAK